MKKKNLIFFLPDFVCGGGGKSITSLCRNLNKKKFQIDFKSEAKAEGQTTVRSIIERNEKPHFQSAYPLDHPYSTWKTRGKVKIKRVIDYIFHNSQDIRGVHCTHILGLPEEEEMEPHRLPGFRYPSDHLAIAARFRISCSERKRK